jgi:hypothetical protein
MEVINMTTTFDAQTLLLLSFLLQDFEVGDVAADPAKYLKKCRFEIETTGQLFIYLGLAKADKQSPLGWKPTAPLLDLVAKSKARRLKPTRKSASLVDSLVLNLMLDTMLGSEHDNYCCYVLLELGLILRDVENDWLPSPELLRLFADSYNLRQHIQFPDPDTVYH